MMQLLCDGVLLDLYDNAGLQFTHENPLFAFDKMKCERTTQFKLPSTPKNDRVFALARIPAYDGIGMRRKFTAQLQAGTTTKDGYLYIGSYDGKDYAAIFVTGELVGLQAIKDAGKLSDILNYTANVMVAFGVRPSVGKGYTFQAIDYKTNGLISPSFRASAVAKDALDILGVPYTFNSDYLRMFKGIPSGIISQSGEFARVISALVLSDPVPVVASAVMSGDYGLAGIFPVTIAGVGGTLVNDGVTYYYKGKVQQFIAHQPISITFPDDWDDNMFVGRFNSQPTEYLDILGAFQFLGDRSFDETKTITGNSLRGRSVDIASGETFTFIDIDDWNPNYSSSSGSGHGWFFEGGSWGNIRFTIEGGEVASGDYVREQDQLPGITLVELLKTLATANGKVLTYSDENGVEFDDLDIDTWPVFELKTLTKRAEVQRSFADYAQRNIIRFDSKDDVLEAERISIEYLVPNVNIKEENELQKFPFSECGAEGMRIFVREPSEDSLLANADTTDGYMQRVVLPMNSGLDRLCRVSTQFKVEARLNLEQYNSIKAKTLLLVDGSKYVWTERSWQKDVAKFTLARV